jgi:hypothetical protein
VRTNDSFAFFLMCSTLFAFLWIIVYWIERLFGIPSLFIEMRSHQGTSQWLDWVVILTCILCTIIAFGRGTLSGFLGFTITLAFCSAVQSLILGRERRKIHHAPQTITP